jgi:hypothetical protein
LGGALKANGVRDQDAGGNWTETDFLASDSDVDGIFDGAEAWGRWCYKGEPSCSGATNNTARVLPALNPDYDGDGIDDTNKTLLKSNIAGSRGRRRRSRM